MNKDRIAYYTGKITSQSMTGIVCTMYEIFFEYLEDCRDVVDIANIRQASKVLLHLKDALDFNYKISFELLSVYDYCDRLLSKAVYTNNYEHIKEAVKLMNKLYESFLEVDRQDKSQSAMSNSQHMEAGLTYGKTDVNEFLSESDNRGFFA